VKEQERIVSIREGMAHCNIFDVLIATLEQNIVKLSQLIPYE